MCREQVNIPIEKPCIFLEGNGRRQTTVTYNAHQDTAASATFTSLPSNIVVKGITFEVRILLPVPLFSVVFGLIIYIFFFKTFRGYVLNFTLKHYSHFYFYLKKKNSQLARIYSIELF
jgi:hypothetical protein